MGLHTKFQLILMNGYSDIFLQPFLLFWVSMATSPGNEVLLGENEFFHEILLCFMGTYTLGNTVFQKFISGVDRHLKHPRVHTSNIYVKCFCPLLSCSPTGFMTGEVYSP